jgi:hypothetical protein
MDTLPATVSTDEQNSVAVHMWVYCAVYTVSKIINIQ